MGSPVVSTWIKAIDNNQFTTWPGLTAELVCKHLPLSIATTQGHLKQERQKLQSTQARQASALTKEISQDYFPKSDVPNKKCNEVI